MIRTVIFIASAAAALFVLTLVGATTGGLCIEVVLPANPLIRVHIFTERFDPPDKPCFAHAVKVGQLRMEVSFGSWSYSGCAMQMLQKKPGQSQP